MADRSPKEKSQVEPSPKNPALLGWLEGCFYGPGDYPQKLEVRLMWGPRHERGGPIIKQILFPPNMTEPSEREESSSESGRGAKADQHKTKPNREALIEISHDILARIQLEVDTTGKSGVYYVLASHLLRDEGPYERFPIRGVPKHPRNQAEDVNEEGDEEEDGVRGVNALAKGYLLGMKQNQQMFEMLGSMVEGVIDRLDRSQMRTEEALEATRTQLLKQQDVVARAMDVNSERKMKEDTHAFKIKVMDRGLNMFEGLAPSFMPGLLGGKTNGNGNGNGIGESPESLTLKTFLRPIEEGGRLTEQQVDAVFGAFDDTPEMNLVRPGVLTIEQGKLVHDVAHCRIHAEELEKLLPGGSLQVTQEQYVRLQGAFKDAMDQIAPIIALLGMVMQKAQARTQQIQTPQQQNQ